MGEQRTAEEKRADQESNVSHAANAAAVLILRGGCLDLDGVPHAHQSCPEDMALWAVLALQDARREIVRLKALLNRDATGLAEGLVQCQKAVRSREWVLESRGPYEWDDDRYKDEAGFALREVVEIAAAALKRSGLVADAAFRPDAQAKLDEIDASSLAPTDDLVACGDHGPDRMFCELSAGHDPRCVHRDGERIWISVDQEIVLVPR